MPEGYVPTEKELKQIKTQYVYTTSDTKYILPSEYCAIHTFVETIPQDPFAPTDPFNPGFPGNPSNPLEPAVPIPTPTPVPDTTDPFSNGGFQSH